MNFFGTSYAFDVEGLGLGYNSMIAGFMEIISFLGLSTFLYNFSNFYQQNSKEKGHRRILLYCDCDRNDVLV